MSNNPNNEASKLFRELHKHFLLAKTLRNPITINLNKKEILILHAKWKEAVSAEIVEQLLPKLLPLFGGHAYQIVLFDAGYIFNVSLAIILTDYSADAYNLTRENLYDLIEDYSETHTCSVSTLTASYPLSEKHPLYSEIKSGTIIWQKGGNNI